MPAYFETEPLSFSCTRCGRCCETAGEFYVFLAEDEAERIRVHLDLSRAWFRRRYLERLDDRSLVLAAATSERCIFLAADGQCRIYPVRPVQCRTYPFWPELVGTRRAWQREARRCEGINRGGAVPIKTIRRALSACRNALP
jgi:Fe-S-cluster containining protein